MPKQVFIPICIFFKHVLCILIFVCPVRRFPQPAISGALGPVANGSTSMSPALERSDRIHQPMSLLVVVQ